MHFVWYFFYWMLGSRDPTKTHGAMTFLTSLKNLISLKKQEEMSWKFTWIYCLAMMQKEKVPKHILPNGGLIVMNPMVENKKSP